MDFFHFSAFWLSFHKICSFIALRLISSLFLLNFYPHIHYLIYFKSFFCLFVCFPVMFLLGSTIVLLGLISLKSEFHTSYHVGRVLNVEQGQGELTDNWFYLPFLMISPFSLLGFLGIRLPFLAVLCVRSEIPVCSVLLY